MNYAVNDKQVLLLGLGLRNNPKNYATVKLYKSSRKPVITIQHHHLAFGVQFKDIQFLSNGKSLLTLCCSTTLSHYISLFRKDKLLTYVDLRENIMGFCGAPENEAIATWGPTLFKLWRHDANTKELLETPCPLPVDSPIIAAVFVKKNHCTLTHDGHLTYYKKGVPHHTYDLRKEVPEQVCAMSATSQGLIVAFEFAPLLVVIDIHKGKLQYRKQYPLTIQNFQKVLHIHVGPEDSYVSVTAQHKAREIELADQNGEIYLFNYGIVDIISTALKDPFEPLFPNGVHKQRIIGIEGSPSKPIFCMLSEERAFKVWEFSYSRGEFRCLYTTMLHEIPLCMAVHPMSFQCAIGYREGLKFYFILHDDLKQVFYENLKQCTALKYTAGGNLLAVGTQNQILLYDPYTYTLQQTIMGHSGTLASLEWNDQLLISTCTQGLVLCYNQTRVVDHSFKAHKGLCQTYDPDFDFLIGCYIDQKVRLFNEKGLNLFYEMDVYPYTYVQVQLFKQLELVVFGTQCGKIRIYLWPFTQFKDDQEFLEFQLHQGAVTSIRLSSDLSFLVTGAEDGSVQICKVREFYDGKEITASELVGKEFDKPNFSLANLYNFNMLAFVSRQSQEIKRDQNKELDFRISNLKSDIEDQKSEITQKYLRYQKEIENNNQQAVADQKEYLSHIMENQDIRLKQLEKQLEKLRKEFEKSSGELKEKTNDQLLSLYRVNDKLKSERDTMIERNAREIEQMNREFESLQSTLGREYDQKYGDLVRRFTDSQDSLKLDELKFKEVFVETEKEYEQLIQQEKSGKLQILEELMSKSEKTRSENTKHKKAIDKFQQRKQEIEILIRDTETQLEHLTQEQKNFVKANKDVEEKLKEREKLIFQKEKEIKNYRNKNGHLKNFKDVNSYRLSSLQEQKQPLQDHLQELDQNMKVMYQELTDEAEAEKNLDTHIEQTEEYIKQTKQNLDLKREKQFRLSSQIKELESQLLQVLALPEITQFKEKLQQVHKENFVQKRHQTLTEEQVNSEIEKNTQQAIREELLRQRDFLSKKINTVMRTSKASDEDKTSLIIKVQNENTQLIKSCNELREQRASLRSHLTNMEKALSIMLKEIEQLARDSDEIIDEELQNPQLDEDFQIQEKPKLAKRISAPKLTPYQQYQKDSELSKLRRSENVLKKVPYRNDLNQLLKEIKMFNTSDAELKDQVQQFLRNDESSSILPQIMRYPVNSSQEETYVGGHESSIINTSIETLKIQLPAIKK